MGIRTEEITPTEADVSPSEGTLFQGVVDVVEPLGNETHIHVDLKGVRFIARCEGRRIIKHKDDIALTMNLNQMHLFDAKSTRVVY